MDKGPMPWQDLPPGAAILEAGNSRANRTGDWGASAPRLEETACIQCGLCWLFCPEMAYGRDPEGFYRADANYCKGCGLCARECPKGAITMKGKP